MSTTHKLLLAVAFTATCLTSLLIYNFEKISTLVLYSNSSSLLHGDNLVLPEEFPSEDEIQINQILQKLSFSFPSETFTHVDNTTSARRSRAFIINPKENYCVGETLIVQLEMFDNLGYSKRYGGDFFKARIYSPKLKAAASGRIEDFNNGTYHVYFTLFWPGNVFVSVVLHHPSEAASALWRVRNQDFGLIQFVGTFGNGTHDVKSDCGFKLDTEKEICKYSREEYHETFYCIRPEYHHCESLTILQSYNKDLSYLSQLEKSIIARGNIAIEVPKNFTFVNVAQCAGSTPKPLERCKIGMESPFPSGFIFHDTWRPAFCNISTQKPIQTCLNDKMIYLMGDSTIRQWYYYLLKAFKGLANLDLHRPGIETKLLAVDPQKNTLLHWKKHSHPIVASRFYSVKDDQYLAEQIDQLAGGPNCIIAFCLGQHFRPFPIRLFIKRVMNMHKALERLLLRSPNTKIVIKLENDRERSAEPERFSDFHGYIQNLIVKDIFKDLQVAVIDAWDMTIAYNTDNVHPPENVIQQQVNLFLTYVC